MNTIRTIPTRPARTNPLPAFVESWLRSALRAPGAPADPECNPFDPARLPGPAGCSVTGLTAGARYVLACLAGPECEGATAVIDWVLSERLALRFGTDGGERP